MTKSILVALVSATAIAAGASHGALAMPNGLPETSMSAAVVPVDTVATKKTAQGSAVRKPAKASGKPANVKNANVKSTSVKNKNVKNTNVKNTNIKNTNIKNTTIRNTNVTSVKVVRPVKVWAPRPYYGTVIGGVTLGTLLAVSAAGAVPVAPAPTLCWFWSDPAMTRGYWDYCVVP